MINEPTVDALTKKMGETKENGEVVEASKYALCVVASKRTRQILEREHARGIVAEKGKDKEIVTACKEIMEGKITYTED